jgi:membrane associated rhomboid family serine protease
VFKAVGIGNWPRAFPKALFLVSILSLAFSVHFSSQFVIAENEIKKIHEDNNDDLKTLFHEVVVATCISKFGEESLCGKAEIINSSSLKIERNISSVEENVNTKKSLIETEVEEDIRIQKEENALLLESQYSLDDSLKEILSLEIRPDEWPAEAQATSAFSKIQEINKQTESKVINTYVSHGLFTSKSMGVWQVVAATFIHQGWGHLLVNILLLLLLGIWVEQALGFKSSGILFLGSSIVGPYLQLFLEKPQVIFGSYAGVMGLLGAFYVIILETKTIVEFELPFFNSKIISIPVYWFFPFLYLVCDLAAFPNLEGARTVHLAHLGGLIFGIIFTWLMKRKAQSSLSDIKT